MPGARDAHDSGLSPRGLGQPLHIRLLGGLSLSTESGGGLALPGSRQRALLAYLLLHRDRPVDRRHLAFLLWPESAEAQALTTLRQLLRDVRAAIPDADRFIEAGRQLVQRRENAPSVLDVDRFESALSSITQQGPTRSGIASLIEGIALYTGDLLPECYDEWIEPARRRLRDLLIGALRRVIGLLEERRDFAGALLHAERLRELEPLDESAFSAELVSASSGISEPAVVAAIEELLERRLVGERRAGA